MRVDGDEPRSTFGADVSRLRSHLLNDANSAGVVPNNPRLLMLAGLPGTGKSTFARELVSRQPFLVVESDRLRKTLIDKPQYTADEHSRVFRACHRLIEEFLGQGYPVIMDATNLVQRNRRPIIAIARKHNAPLAIVVVTAPPDLVRQRLAGREAGMDPCTWSDAGLEIYSRMAPTWQRAHGQHFELDTSRDMTPVLRKVLDWARS